MSKLPALSMATPKQSTHTHTQRTVEKRGACYLSITVTSRRIEPLDYSFRLPSHSSPVSTKQPCTHFSHVPESQSMAAALFWGRPFSNRRGAATVERPQPLSLSRCMLLFFVVSKKRESLPSAIFFSFLCPNSRLGKFPVSLSFCPSLVSFNFIFPPCFLGPVPSAIGPIVVVCGSAGLGYKPLRA